MKRAARPTATAMSRPNRTGFDMRTLLGGETNWPAVVVTAGSPVPLLGRRARSTFLFRCGRCDAPPFPAGRRPCEDPVPVLCRESGWQKNASRRVGDDQLASG